MRKYLYLMLLILFSQIPPTAAQIADVSATVQTESLEMGMLATGRPSTLRLWFPRRLPEGKCIGLLEKQFCLADSAVTDKVLILSHGAMGSARGLSWLGEKLAAVGFVVLGINHFGESSIYGQDTQDPRVTSLIWQRPQDISALLDRLPAQNIFQKKINWSNAIVVGHSSGGQTAAVLLGATFDLERLANYCASALSKDDLSCKYGSGAASAPATFKLQFTAQQKDTRVKLIVMLDPALGSSAQPSSMRSINTPTLVIGAQNNDFLPWKQHGHQYATEIPNAKTNLLTGQEGHFIFITACNHQTKVMGVPLCEDRPGVDRMITQDVLAEAVIKFIRANDDVFTVLQK